MSLQRQAPHQDLTRTLAHQLNLRDLRLAETTLGMCSPEAALSSLATILEHERRTSRLSRKLVRPLAMLVWSGVILWGALSFERTSLMSLILVGIFVWGLIAFLRSVGRASRLRNQNVRLIAGTLVRSAGRRSLGAVLTIAEAAFTHSPVGSERDICRTYLTRTLSRTPTDELRALTAIQRRGLRTITSLALTSPSTVNAPLATAGLLALCTLRDPGLLEQAQKSAVGHPQEHVRTAALEYLTSL